LGLEAKNRTPHCGMVCQHPQKGGENDGNNRLRTSVLLPPESSAAGART
jgi:hypothetical protein